MYVCKANATKWTCIWVLQAKHFFSFWKNECIPIAIEKGVVKILSKLEPWMVNDFKFIESKEYECMQQKNKQTNNLTIRMQWNKNMLVPVWSLT